LPITWRTVNQVIYPLVNQQLLFFPCTSPPDPVPTENVSLDPARRLCNQRLEQEEKQRSAPSGDRLQQGYIGLEGHIGGCLKNPDFDSGGRTSSMKGSPLNQIARNSTKAGDIRVRLEPPVDSGCILPQEGNNCYWSGAKHRGRYCGCLKQNLRSIRTIVLYFPLRSQF